MAVKLATYTSKEYPCDAPPLKPDSSLDSSKFDQSKLCSSSLWSFYENAKVEMKAPLLFRALTSELGSAFADTLTYVTQIEELTRSVEGTRDVKNNKFDALLKETNVDQILSKVMIWGLMYTILSSTYLPKRIDPNEYG